MKLISCIMPIKKDLSYLDKSIESILNQSYKNFELIIIDNSSNKSVLKKITTYKKDKRIKIFKKSRKFIRIIKLRGYEVKR